MVRTTKPFDIIHFGAFLQISLTDSEEVPNWYGGQEENQTFEQA